MTEMNFFHNAFTESSTISYHMEAMRNRVTQLTFTCSKSTIETLEKGVEYVQKGNNENTRTTSMTLFSTVSIVYFD